MEDKLVDLVVKQVMDKVAANAAAAPANGAAAFSKPGMTEFVGTAFGDTIGIVIANIDSELHQKLGIDPKYRYWRPQRPGWRRPPHYGRRRSRQGYQHRSGAD